MNTQMEEVPFLEVKREAVLEGSIYTTRGGQVVIDSHPTCEEHLLAQATHAEQPMHRCRKYLRELIPQEWLGMDGQFLIDRAVNVATGEVVTVSISFLKR
jgi:hypothetical protein